MAWACQKLLRLSLLQSLKAGMDEVEILKVPIDYDVKKIGFILLEQDSEELDKEFDLELTPKQDKAKEKFVKNQCDICKRICSNPSNLKRHKKSNHDSPVKTVGFILPEEDSQKLDVEIDLDLTPKQDKAKEKLMKNQCDICKRVYTNPSNLKRHKKSSHDNARLDCQICNLKFDAKFKLTLHMKKQHIYNRACDVCGVKENSNLDLDEHMKEHQATEMNADEIYDMIV